MLRDDEYELMPHTELEYLRREVERLKRNPLGDTQASITLLDSMNKLGASVTRLNDVLTGANDEMIKAYSDASAQEQLRKLGEQNEKLARGIVALAELIKEVQRKQESMPSIDQFIAQRPTESQPVQMNQPDIKPVAPKNPFTADAEEFAPLLNQPLPRPTIPQGVVTAVEQMRPESSYTRPPEQNEFARPPEHNAPGFMMHPGLKENIPETDIPPPPPPRRF